MKKKILSITAAGMLAVSSFLSLDFKDEQQDLCEIIAANIEALADGEGATEVVKCYCKVNWFSKNVCTAQGDGSFCGYDPCANNDGNCR